jgi:hypothetical protein
VSLQQFVTECPPSALDTLVTTLYKRAEEYVEEGRLQAIAGGKDWKLRSVARHTMAHALNTLAEEITQERQQVASWQQTGG